MAVVATLWVLSGSFKVDSESESEAVAKPETTESKLFSVTVEQFEAREYTQRIDLQGEIDADRKKDQRGKKRLRNLENVDSCEEDTA